jgi:uncharacterized membrane protein YfcA
MFAVLVAGMAAGAINAVVGSGTLITFPTLLAFGVPPITANISNTLGLIPGSFSAAWGYRRELSGQRQRIARLASGSVLGGLLGAVLLLTLPEETFAAIVPILVSLGLLLVIAQKPIQRWVLHRHRHVGGLPHLGAWWVWPGVFACGVYGGYFGAAQGVLLIAVMGAGLPESLQRVNALKNVLAAFVNTVAGVLFALVGDVDWLIVSLIAIGSVVGAQLGSAYGRRLPDPVLRSVIVAVGVVALAVFLRS